MNEYDQDRPAICDMCDHPDHADSDCGEETGYDHLNGFHECGCPGSFREQLAQAWDEGREHGMDEDLCRLDLNPYRVTSPGSSSE